MDVAYAPGSLVTARGREWVVLPDSDPDLLVLRPLGGSDDEIAAVFPDLEQVDQARFPAPSPDDLGDARAAGLLRTALRIGFRSSAGPFRSLASIAVEPRPYQLVPLLMAMRQPTVRMAICDDVGIGKTVESGLIASELLAQGEASGLAVLCSPALAEQWQEELRTKFGIDAELVLASTVPRLERALAYGESLFDKHRIVVVSTDFIKSPRHRDDFVAHCPDLVIVDEAHTCVPTDGAGARTAQLRYELLSRLARDQSRHLLLVTATPHSGKDESFRRMIGLLDTGLATVDLAADQGRRRLAACYVQRRRADIRSYLNEDTAFPDDRLFKEEPYRLSPAYRALLDDAIAYASERVTDASGHREQRVAWWSAIALLRSMVSSPRAAAQTLVTRSESAAARTPEEADALGWPVTADMADDNPAGIDASPGADATMPSSRSGVPSRLRELAERASALEGPDEDHKLARLTKTVKKLLDDGYDPIVFCRYIPTADYVAEHLDGKLGRKTEITAVTGTLSPAQRIERIERMAQAAEDNGSRRVLVATDCLSEGVNLQHWFNAVVHYDLAWNPTRHEQREGRVDRFGQRAPNVRVVTIYGEDNGIDGKVLEILIKKHREIRKSTGISVPIPDETSGRVTDAIVEWLLLRNKGHEQQALFDLDSEQQALFEFGEVMDREAKVLDSEWNSMAERERRSRSRFAQGSIHPDEVAREVAAIRAALGSDDEITAFTRTSLRALNADLTGATDDELHRDDRQLARRPAGRDRRAGRGASPHPVQHRPGGAARRGVADPDRPDRRRGGPLRAVRRPGQQPGRAPPPGQAVRRRPDQRRAQAHHAAAGPVPVPDGAAGPVRRQAADRRGCPRPRFRRVAREPGMAGRRDGTGAAQRDGGREHGPRVRPGSSQPHPRRPPGSPARSEPPRCGTRRGTPGGAPPGAPQHRPGRPRGPGNAAG